jgi:hypothetical protein
MAGKKRTRDNSFYKLATDVNAIINKNVNGKRSKSNMEDIQRSQVEAIMSLEREFKATLLTYERSSYIYKEFLTLILGKNKNILSAKPYFRERVKDFSKYISPKIKAEDVEGLKNFAINYYFIKFTMDNWSRSPDVEAPPALMEIYKKFLKVRNELIENNIPLAINRAKLFYEKTPKSHISLMEMINESVAGMINGIDKYTGEYARIFRGVCIGRMVGGLISIYSETFIHFFPTDKKILYKANTLAHRKRIDDIELLTKEVNGAFSEELKVDYTEFVTVEQLTHLMNGSSIVSADATIDQEGHNIYSGVTDHNQNVEEDITNLNDLGEIYSIVDSKLDIIEQKVLKLRGLL